MSKIVQMFDAGDGLLVVQSGDTVDAAIDESVRLLDVHPTRCLIAASSEMAPTFRSLAMHYDPIVVSRTVLLANIGSAINETGGPRRREGALVNSALL